MLTTFIMPFGRYCFNKLPFRISIAPEVYQKMMNNILEDIQRVLCHMDDGLRLVYGKDKQEHDSCLTAVLKGVKAAGITLNPTKCEFSKPSLTFLGHLINQEGIFQDPAKLLTIKDMPPPKTVKELQRFLGMVHQLGNFSSNISDLSDPLQQLLSNKQAWLWAPDQENSYKQLQSESTTPKC